MVLQYTCDTNAAVTDPTLQIKLRDGTTTTQVDTDGSPGDQTRGVHESAAYYSYCTNRDRNRGLFTADQNLNSNSARVTRQNPDVNNPRRGLECPEERDYYPYWLPTPFIDIAYLTDQTDPVDPTWGQCANVLANSQNTNKKYRCFPPTGQENDNSIISTVSENECTQKGGSYRSYIHFGQSEVDLLFVLLCNHTAGLQIGVVPISSETIVRVNQSPTIGLSHYFQP
jgi:hypothetical protein